MRRVVITGLGAVTPVGNNVPQMWENLKTGVNGIAAITQFDASQMKVRIAGEVKNLQPELFLSPQEVRRLDRTAILALIAAQEAYQDSQLEKAVIDPYRFGVYVTSGIGGVNTLYQEIGKAVLKGGDRVSPFFVTNVIVNLIPGQISIKYQAKGPSLAVVTACSSSTNAIGEAFRAIRDGYMDIAFTGGAESPINEIGVGGFSSMRALNTSNDPDNASIPFDKRRSGFVIGEGAGVLILEEYEHAVKRGAKIYAEIVGYSSTSDAYHITAPDETAEAITVCMKQALRDARLEKEKIDYINPHGTSTVYNDKLETKAIYNVFGDYTKNILMSATKSMTGHTMGAIGAMEAIICAKTVQEDTIVPMINYREFDPECDLNFVLDRPMHKQVKYALSNNLGFGGHNATIIIKKI